MSISRPLRVAGGVALALTLALAACGGDDGDTTATTAPASDDGGVTTTAAPTDDGGIEPADLPDEVCDLVSADEVGAVLGETVEAAPGPQGSCTYNGEGAESLYPTIYLENAADFDITGVGDPIEIAGHDGYIRDSGAETGASVFEGVLVVDSVLIRVVANSDDIEGSTPAVEGLLELTAGKL